MLKIILTQKPDEKVSGTNVVFPDPVWIIGPAIANWGITNAFIKSNSTEKKTVFNNKTNSRVV